MRSQPSFEMPELPKACVRCGTPYGLTRQPFHLFVRGQGALPLVRCAFDLPFCQSCWNRFVTARFALWIALVVGATALGGALALSALTRSYGPALVGFFLGASVVGGAVWFLRRTTPRRAARGRSGVVLDVPRVGEVRISDDDRDAMR